VCPSLWEARPEQYGMPPQRQGQRGRPQPTEGVKPPLKSYVEWVLASHAKIFTIFKSLLFSLLNKKKNGWSFDPTYFFGYLHFPFVIFIFIFL
jgi:hypothetical protein